MASAIDTALEKISGFERPVRLAIEAILVVVLALIVARLVWLVTYPEESVATFTDRPLATPLTGNSSALAISVDRTIILRANPFESDSAEEVLAAVPETSLNIQLDGLRMSNGEGIAGNATIRTPNGTAQNFRVGDEIIPGVTLERILSDRVIINRDGATETVMRAGRQEGLSVIGDESQAVSANTVAASRAAPAQQPSAPPITGRIAGPDVLFSAVRASLVNLESGAQGYQLSANGSADAMRQAGFEPGDVLLQFNGTSVAETDLNELLERFGEVETAILRVNRDGTDRTIRLEIGE